MSDTQNKEQDSDVINHLKDVNAKVEENAYKISESFQALSTSKPYVDNVCTSLVAFVSETLRKLQGEGTLEGKLNDALAALGTVSQFANNYSSNHTRQLYNLEGQLIEKQLVAQTLSESIAGEKGRLQALQRVGEKDNSDEDIESRQLGEHPEKIAVIREHKEQKDSS